MCVHMLEPTSTFPMEGYSRGWDEGTVKNGRLTAVSAGNERVDLLQKITKLINKTNVRDPQ